MKNNELIKIIVADTSFIIRKGLKAIIEEHSRLESTGEAADPETLRSLIRKDPDSILILDHSAKDGFSIDFIESLRSEHPALKILVISHDRDAEEIRRIINLGIRNYLLKDCDEKEITDAIMACHKGEKYFCGQIIDVLLNRELKEIERCASGSISEREMEVIRQLVQGKRPKEVAESMGLSYHTIVTHKRNIYAKLGIRSSIELAQYAVKTGLLK